MNIKCIIIDDEPLAIKVIENYLNEFQNFQVVATFNNPLEALIILKNENIDVIFLDINMGKMNGLSFVKSVDLKANVVITTAHREYALESYDLNILDYLVKPIPFERFLKAINRITQQIHLQRGQNTVQPAQLESHIFLKVDKKLIKVKFNDIYYIESLKDYIMVFTTTGDYLVHKSLTGFTEELPHDNFLRIHRSFTIALNKINCIEGNSVEINKKRIPIGRKYLATAKKLILN
jgi:DNA-binding LytR/AlgR family response regulator